MGKSREISDLAYLATYGVDGNGAVSNSKSLERELWLFKVPMRSERGKRTA